MKRFAYTVAQIVWGLPQTVTGAVMYLAYRDRPHFSYHGAIVTVWPYASSLSLGLFVFLSHDPRVPAGHRKTPLETYAGEVLVHEYGHTIQSLILGPLYLPLVGLPSLLWAHVPACKRLRARRDMSYYRFVTERNANKLGEAVCHEPAPR